MEINIKHEIETISRKYSDHKFYLFGSFLTNKKTFGDIDILILYENTEFIKFIRRDFQNVKSYEIFHLMFLSFDEELEMNFIEKVNAEEI